MRNSKIVNALAVVGALIVILGIGSAANRAFAEPLQGGLNSAVATASDK